jgi:hypothetical protein
MVETSVTFPEISEPSGELLQVRDLTVNFPTDDGIVQAVRGVSFTLHEREVLGIVAEVRPDHRRGLLPRRRHPHDARAGEAGTAW